MICEHLKSSSVGANACTTSCFTLQHIPSYKSRLQSKFTCLKSVPTNIAHVAPYLFCLTTSSRLPKFCDLLVLRSRTMPGEVEADSYRCLRKTILSQMHALYGLKKCHLSTDDYTLLAFLNGIKLHFIHGSTSTLPLLFTTWLYNCFG